MRQQKTGLLIWPEIVVTIKKRAVSCLYLQKYENSRTLTCATFSVPDTASFDKHKSCTNPWLKLQAKRWSLKKKIQSFLAIFNLQDPPPPALEEGKVLRENYFIFKEVAIA